MCLTMKAILFAIALFSAPVFASSKILIMQPTSERYHPEIADSLFQSLSEAFAMTKKFEVIERSQVENLLLAAQVNGIVASDKSTAAAVGRLAGAEHMVLSSFSLNESSPTGSYGNHFATHYHVSLKLNTQILESRTGKTLETQSMTSSQTADTLQSATALAISDLKHQISQQAAKNHPITRYIIKKIHEDGFMIDIGSASHIAPGQQFQVVSYADDFMHPVNGQTIKGERSVLAELKVVSVMADTAIARLTDGEAEQLKAGMQIEPKPQNKYIQWLKSWVN